MTILAVLKSTGAADCGNVEASFAILSAHVSLYSAVTRNPLKRNGNSFNKVGVKVGGTSTSTETQLQRLGERWRKTGVYFTQENNL